MKNQIGATISNNMEAALLVSQLLKSVRAITRIVHESLTLKEISDIISSETQYHASFVSMGQDCVAYDTLTKTCDHELLTDVAFVLKDPTRFLKTKKSLINTLEQYKPKLDLILKSYTQEYTEFFQSYGLDVSIEFLNYHYGTSDKIKITEQSSNNSVGISNVTETYSVINHLHRTALKQCA